MELFKKPSWLKPEINEPIYWLHLVILAFVALWIIDCFFTKSFVLSFDDMFNLKNILYSVPALAAGDIVAHTVLKLN